MDRPTGKIEVNFHTDLTQLIRETRYLDRMGFTIPDIALNITLQENKYHQCLDGLNRMLENYYLVSISCVRFCTVLKSTLCYMILFTWVSSLPEFKRT